MLPFEISTMSDNQITEVAKTAIHSGADLFHRIMEHESNLFSNVMTNNATASEYVEAGGQALLLGALAIKSPKLIESFAARSAPKVNPIGIVELGGGFDREAIASWAERHTPAGEQIVDLSKPIGEIPIEIRPSQNPLLDFAAVSHPGARAISMSTQYGGTDSPAFIELSRKAAIRGVNLQSGEASRLSQ
jgi:hypothetical protein